MFANVRGCSLKCSPDCTVTREGSYIRFQINKSGYYTVISDEANCPSCVDDPSLCSGAFPVCDTTTKNCKACTDSNECAAGKVCKASTGECINGCTSNSSCSGTTPFCDSSDKFCKSCSTDTTNAVCSGNTPVCNALGACEKCDDNNDCDANSTTPICNTVSGACEMCDANSDCTAAGKVCQVSTGKCVQCNISSDCSGNTPTCQNNVCVACTTDNSGCVGTKPVCQAAGACSNCTMDS